MVVAGRRPSLLKLMKMKRRPGFRGGRRHYLATAPVIVGEQRKGKNVHLLEKLGVGTRVAADADAFDALISVRPWRRPRKPKRLTCLQPPVSRPGIEMLEVTNKHFSLQTWSLDSRAFALVVHRPKTRTPGSTNFQSHFGPQRPRIACHAEAAMHRGRKSRAFMIL